MFKNPFSFIGRIRRKEYCLSFVIYAIPAIFLNFQAEKGDGDSQILTLLAYIPLLWFVWAQGAKRCHDLGKTGWFQIIPFYFFVMMFADGFPSENKYGLNLKERDNMDESIVTE